MATILDLERSYELYKLDPALDFDEQEWRTIYVLPRTRKWIETDLLGLVSSWNSELSPAQQLDGLIWVFGSGQPLTYGEQFKPLTHIRDGVWELKTADLRLFGWFKKKDCFIGAAIDDATKIKKFNLYYGYVGEVVRFRDSLDLDAPKFIAGDNPHDVVSDFNYP